MKKITLMLLVAACLTACGGGGGGGGSSEASAAPAPVVTPMKIAAWGDSLTQGSYPSQLATMMGRTVFNGGAGGQSASQIAARQGGLLPLVTLTANTIPATTSDVAITAISVNPLNIYSDQTIQGTVAGVPVKLTRNAPAETYTLNRLTAGPSVSVPPATPFIVDTNGHDSEIAVIWAGRNGVIWGDPAEIKANIAQMIAFLKPTTKRFVVLAVLNGSSASERIGQANYIKITLLNNDLSTLYPANYLDVRQALIQSYNPASPQDNIDLGDNTVPASLRTDSIHLTDAGYGIVARKVADFITAKGW